MDEPSIVLGVPLMDRDHAHIEGLLARAAETDDAGLARLLKEVESETRAHFEREEAMMREQALCVLACHMVQHEMLLGHFRQAQAAVEHGDTHSLRSFLEFTLPALLLRHINTADRVTAGLLMHCEV